MEFLQEFYDNLNKPLFWVDISISAFLIILFLFITFHFVKRKFVVFFYIFNFALLVAIRFFNLELAVNVLMIFITAATVVFLFTNIADIRPWVSNALKGKGKAKVFDFSHQKVQPEKIFDHDAMYKIISDTVASLSKQKIGALISFERLTPLSDVMRSGTPIHAPISQELLLTIFYPGTRLHDGAVVIKGNEIAAASVYYTPTTKPLAGKYGSRHRAAIGISEISDAVTVVVSEETGRISIAYDGELESVTWDNFLRVFEHYMKAQPEKEEAD